MPIFRKALYAVLLLGAVALVYGAFLHNPAVFDDSPFFKVDQLFEHFRGFHPFEVRWLPYFSIVWTVHDAGLDITWLRLEGLLLHAATGIALFFFLERLFELVLKKEDGRHEEIPHVWVAFFCALFFLWHPVAVYGAAYLIERTIVMATLFSLLALLVYMQGLVEERRGWLAASVVLYGFAVFSKEHAVMLPAVMLALTLLLRKPSAELVRKLWAVFAACAAIALWVVLQKKGVLGGVYEVTAPQMLGKAVPSGLAAGSGAPPHFLALSILTQCFLFFKYWLLWLVPNPAWMSVDMREPFAGAIFSHYLFALLAFLAYGALGVWLLLKRGHKGLLGFALLFPWLMFATEFTVVRIQEPLVLYRSYLWMAGAFAALPLLLAYVRARVAFVGMLVCALVLAMLAVNRLVVFSEPVLVWDDAEALVRDKQDLPGVARIYYNRGWSLTKIGRYQEALADYQRALKLGPEDFNNHYAVGSGLMNVNRYAEAATEFSKVLEMKPNHVQARLGRGLSNLELGNRAAALADLEISCGQGAKIACAEIKVLRNSAVSSSGAPRPFP